MDCHLFVPDSIGADVDDLQRGPDAAAGRGEAAAAAVAENLKSFTARDAEHAEEQKSLTAKDARDAKNHSLRA